jgi:peptidoglycan hydrolase-like protein with peptidoglycan-binding domain
VHVQPFLLVCPSLVSGQINQVMQRMTTVWYLNAFLTSWRAAVNKKFPHRSKASDGTIGDLTHQAESFSEHNPDADGSVDAWDMDDNLDGPNSNPLGTANELAEIERLKAAFQRLPESQLWIHNQEIANRDVDNWRRRPYKGASAHREHVHWQSRSSMEKVAVSASVLDNVVTAINNPLRLVGNETSTIPAWPVSPDVAYDAGDVHNYYKTVERAQRRLHERGWRITIDGHYGPATAHIVTAFQREKRLKPDGKLGPKTWRALWATPID